MLFWTFILVLCWQLHQCIGMELADQAGTDHEDGGEHWPEAQVPFILDFNFTSKLLNEFNSALAEFHRHTCIRFRQKTENDQFFLRIYSGDGCWSYVGMRRMFENRGQPMSLSVECDSKGVILHELVHVLGFFHEHTRFDRDNYIVLNAQNIDPGQIKQFNRRRKHKVDEMGAYDLNSILHYEGSAFALDPAVPTIIPIISNNVNQNEIIKMGQRDNLSPADIKKLNRYYNCTPMQTVIVEVKNAIESGLDRNSVIPTRMHSLRQQSRPKSFYWFKSAGDFQTRTGQEPPSWLRFVTFNDEAHEFPRAIQCERNEESNCQDRAMDCLELTLRGECERRPGYMLKFCRRSCCNCSDHKCFDTNDERKFRTLCLGRFRNKSTNIEMTACQMDATRQNALEYCPKTCFSCYNRPTLNIVTSI